MDKGVSGSLFMRFWALFGRAERRRFVRLQLLSLLMGVSTMLGVTAVLPFLAVCADPELIGRNAWLMRLSARLGLESTQAFIALLGAAFVLLVWFGNAMNLLGGVAIRRFAHDTAARWQEALFAEYLRRDALFHARSDGAVLASRVVRHVDGCALGLLQGILLLVTGAVTCLLILLSALLIDPLAALLAGALFTTAYAAIYSRVRARLLDNGRTQSRRWSERARLMAESFGAIKEILVRGNQDFFRRIFAGQSAAIARTGADTLTIAQLPRNLIECLAAAALVAAALIGAGMAQAGEVRWLAEITFFALAAYRLMPALQQCFSAMAHIAAERAVFDAVEPDLRAALAAPAPADMAPTAGPGRDWPQREIVLEHVSFRYAAHLAPAIRDVSLTIPAGARVAFVGANGSGKSTLADLIVGLLRPETGAILVDGEKLDASMLDAWQSCIAYVPQTGFLLNASVAENIAFGVPREQIDRARLHEAARQAQLEELIASLPRGYDELLGERGVRLSGGQRQLVAIARALYREPRLLVLDEATNALDASNERRVIMALRDGAAPRTTILIAHHAAALRECDMAFTFDQGSLVATNPGARHRAEAS
ncbi:MAG TPA: ABC transporter ATP-binding protein [Steroidobacteraceae bacterium]|nr:ABC transporter ATP-binding protein [Steroidobacteraceae bacterium]